MAGRVDAAWREVDTLIDLKNRDGYAKAVALMVDLRTVAHRPGGDPAAHAGRVAVRLQTHARRYSFVEVAKRAGLP